MFKNMVGWIRKGTPPAIKTMARPSYRTMTRYVHFSCLYCKEWYGGDPQDHLCWKMMENAREKTRIWQEMFFSIAHSDKRNFRFK